MASNRENAEEFFSAGLEMLKRKDYSEAIRLFEMSLKCDSENPIYYRYRGEVLFHMGNREESFSNLKNSIVLYNANIARRPDIAEYHDGRAEVLKFIANYFDPDVETILSLGVEMLPQDEYKDKTDLLLRKYASIYGEVLREYDKALHLDPDNVDFRLHKASTMQFLGDLTGSDYGFLYKRYFKRDYLYQEAMNECDSVLNKCYSREAHMIKGGVLYSLGRYEECINECDMVLNNSQDDIEALALKGLSLERLNRLDEALEVYNSIISKHPDDSEMHNLKASVLYSLKRYDESISECDAAISCSADNYIAHGNKANALSELHRYEEALEEYNKALQIAPYSSDIRRNKIITLNRMGMKEEADRELNEGARLNRSILFKP